MCAGDEDDAPDARVLSREGDAFTATDLLDVALLEAAQRLLGRDLVFVAAPATTHLLASDDPVALRSLAAQVHASAGASALSPEVLRVRHGLVVGVEREPERAPTPATALRQRARATARRARSTAPGPGAWFLERMKARVKARLPFALLALILGMIGEAARPASAPGFPALDPCATTTTTTTTWAALSAAPSAAEAPLEDDRPADADRLAAEVTSAPGITSASPVPSTKVRATSAPGAVLAPAPAGWSGERAELLDRAALRIRAGLPRDEVVRVLGPIASAERDGEREELLFSYPLDASSSLALRVSFVHDGVVEVRRERFGEGR